MNYLNPSIEKKSRTLFVFVFVGMIPFSIAQAAKQERLQVGPTLIVRFDEGSSNLRSDEKERLKYFLDRKLKGMNVDELQIASWSDNPISLGKSELSAADRNLAGRRGDTIREFIQRPKKSADVVLHNMAERSTWLGRMFESDDALLKSEIQRGADAPMSQEEFRVFRDSGKPSVAVVVSIVKQKE